MKHLNTPGIDHPKRHFERHSGEDQGKHYELGLGRYLCGLRIGMDEHPSEK